MTCVLRISFLLMLSLVLGGCMTPYQPRGATGGYTEQKLDEATYRVTFFGNGNTPRDRVFRYWLYRCAELTLQSGYDSFVIAGRARPNNTGDSYALPVHAGLPPADYVPNRTARYVPTYVYVPGGTFRVYTANGVIHMLKGDTDPGDAPFFLARKVLADLDPEVKKDIAGARPAGNSYDPDVALGTAVQSATPPPTDAPKPSLEALKDLLPDAANSSSGR